MLPKIGFIGLGAMGFPIAKNLLKAEYELYVGYHKNKKPASELEKMGATICETHEEIASHSDFIFLVLPNSKEVDEVLFATNGLMSGIQPGTVVIDMSTIDLFESRRFADLLQEANCEFVDAPISGGPAGAEKATMAIMIGAKPETYDKIKDILPTIAKGIVYCGGNGLGLAAKMANNLIASASMVAISEALSLSIKAGIDPDALYDVLKGATANSTILNLKFPAYLKDNYDPGFKLSLMCKDIGIITDVAKKLGTPTIVGSVVEQIYNMCKQEHGDKDSGAVSLFYQDQTGVSFKSQK